jgi:NAD(P)H-dependent flavin oxidoreductase YrpB (nitropropane dioxygenase family)
METRINRLFGIEHPIFAFCQGVEAAAAVSKAGGLGVFPGGHAGLDELDAMLTWMDRETAGRPYGVDLLFPRSRGRNAVKAMPSRAELEKKVPREHKEFVEGILDRYAVPEIQTAQSGEVGSSEAFRGMLSWLDRSKDAERAEIVLSHSGVRLISSGLGPPTPEVVERAHAKGVKIAGMVGAVNHAAYHVQAGADLIVAQGAEAGGHTGEISTMVLVPQVVDAVAPIPVLAAGGIASGRQAAAALALGADGVWCGSVWLTAKEYQSHVTPLMLAKYLAATSRDTVRTLTWDGMGNRVLRSAWDDEWEKPGAPRPLQPPLQGIAAGAALARIRATAEPGTTAAELISGPIGQVVGVLNKVTTVADILHDILAEYDLTMKRMAQLIQ